jgi:hypothetical protein
LQYINTTTKSRTNKISSYICRAEPNDEIYEEKIIESVFMVQLVAEAAEAQNLPV